MNFVYFTLAVKVLLNSIAPSFKNTTSKGEEVIKLKQVGANNIFQMKRLAR